MTLDRLDRRRFLGLSAGVAALAAGCSSSDDPAPTASTSSSTPVPTTSAAGPPDFAALDRGLAGTVVTAGGAGYDTAKQLYDPRYDASRPAAVALPATAQDVAECVKFARRYKLPIVARGGGHSYGGYSTGSGLVVNLSKLNTVDTSAGPVAVVGGGAQLIDVYAGLAATGRGIPAGSCPTVGVGGLTLGGGIGVLARAWGLTCDTLASAELVTADGTVRTVSANQDEDLFWALRGGGGGNFGIVTAFRFNVRSADDIAHRFVSWSGARAAQVIPAWLAWISAAPDELWSNLHLDVSASGSVSVRATVTYLGASADLDDHLDSLEGSAGAFTSSSGSTQSYLDTMKTMAGCTGQSVAACRSYDRESWAGSSDVIGKPLSAAGAQALVGAAKGFGGPISVILDALGGAVGRVNKGDTAFWHRDALCTVQYYASLSGPAAAAYQGLGKIRAAMAPHTTGGAYVNYLDPTIRNWQQAYYGDNYMWLQQAKRKWDPDGLFRFAQGVTG